MSVTKSLDQLYFFPNLHYRRFRKIVTRCPELPACPELPHLTVFQNDWFVPSSDVAAVVECVDMNSSIDFELMFMQWPHSYLTSEMIFWCLVLPKFKLQQFTDFVIFMHKRYIAIYNLNLQQHQGNKNHFIFDRN